MGELIFFTPFICFTTDTYVLSWFVAVWGGFVLKFTVGWLSGEKRITLPLLQRLATNMFVLLLFLS